MPIPFEVLEVGMLVKSQFGIASLHPGVAAGYFALVIALALVAQNPWMQAVGLLGAACVLVGLDGCKGLRFVSAVLALGLVVALVNPLFNTRGETALFVWWGGRPYTLEALAAGALTAATLAQTLLWFASLSLVLTSDKLMFLFGRWAPSLVLVLTLALRLVTTLRRKIQRTSEARACIGLGGGSSLTERVREAGAVLGSVTAGAFEDGVTTADSMKSRGFGLSGVTRCATYRFDRRDGALAALAGVLVAVIVVALAQGSFAIEFFPQLALAPFGVLSGCALGCYGMLVFLPLGFQGWEVIRWRSIVSSI